MKSSLVLLFLVHVTLVFASTPPSASELRRADKMFVLMGKRLDLMRDIALDKWQENAPEEKARESLRGAETLMHAQIKTAIREQRRWRASWDAKDLEKSAPVVELKKWRKQLGARLEKFSLAA